MLEDFTARLKNDPRFKNMSSASIYNLFIEMLTATMDMTNYYMERTSEEAFIDTAKLDSSVIKHGKNLGYNPIRNTPAEAEIAVVIRGPLPQALMAADLATIYFPQEDMELTYNGKKYILNTDYSYTLTKQDIIDGQSSTWSKTLYFSKPADSVNYVELSGEKLYNDASLIPIKVFQGEVKVDTIFGVSNTSKLGKSYQFYDIDNLKFSNWYGKRDPNGWYKDQFFKKNSWCKVGIGKNQDEAFADENLYDIEDVSIYLNSELQKERTNNEYDLLNICSITTNSDKTVRLRFGDGVNVSNGLNKEDQNIYIQYIECDGADANKVGTTNSELKINNKIWATFAGSTPIDMSSNVKLIFNSDIANGVDFEDQQSIKNNAPLYFASNNKLVTKQDFISYFRGLSTPIRVKNAIAWGQDEIENGGNVTYKYIQNCISYCIAASLYNTKSTVYSPINVLTDKNSNQSGVFSVYGTANSYLEHLTDFLKYLNSYDSFHAVQYMNNPSEQWLKNIKTIRENALPKMIMNSKLYSFPPIVQYYDVVGSVSVNSLSKLQEYKRDVENEIYKWLDNNCNFGTKIYKSDIVKFFNKRPETSYVDLDIRVSDIIKAQDVSYAYNIKTESIQNVFIYNPSNDITSDGSNSDTSNYKYNCIRLPKVDNAGASLNVDNLKKKNVRLKLNAFRTSGNKKTDVVYQNEFFTSENVYETETDVYISFNGALTINKNIKIDYNSKLTIIVSYGDDFYSTSNFSTSNAASYGLSTDYVNSLEQFVRNWVINATAVNEANRAIPLPYFVSAMGTNTREETIIRKGILQNAYETQLTEKAFWLYLIPTIIREYYPNIDLADEDINGEKWTQIDTLVRDLYTQFKATFCDSILDDNNNIVNFSMENELPVVRLNIKYKYGV